MVTTAHPKKQEAPWVISTVSVFEDLGISVRFVDLEESQLPGTEDIVYVCGGNTPRLLKASREIDFKQSIHLLIKRGGLYIGSSAGSILLSPSIESALQIEPSDENKVGLKEFTGLNMIPFHVIVHYNDSMKRQYDAFVSSHTDLVFTLRDGEYIIVKGNTYHHSNS